MIDLNYYKGRRVLITGHTGFKGAWMCRVLLDAGAMVTGYSLAPPTDPSLFSMCGVCGQMRSVLGDVRDLAHLMKVFDEVHPEIVLHLAAQPIVRESYEKPVYTYETNVMGTVNVLECVRTHPCVKSFLNVTTDKVYLNQEWVWGYREDEPLDGYDPYSNSKSCSELVTHSYQKSFFTDERTAISTARAGNVIGGGDFARDRIIPDCVRAAADNQPILVRNPYSIRPYQHVLEPIFCYLMIAQKQLEDIRLAAAYNIGPDECDCVTTGELVELFCKYWPNARWYIQERDGPHESKFLRLDNSLLKATFHWNPRWRIADAVAKTVEWSRVWLENGDITAIMRKQIAEYCGGLG